MAVNLTPQYHEADEAYKKAKNPQERLDCLKKMWVLVPKHKASEKLQAELKTKLSLARAEVEKEASKPKKGGASVTSIPRQGAGQILLVGPPNSGKSRILTRLTRATPEVAPYPFTTREPSAGMMDWKDVRVQLIDTPPITADLLEPVVNNMVRSCDAVALVVDLADDDCVTATEAVLAKLESVKTRLVGSFPEEIDDPSFEFVKTILVANKSADPDAEVRLEFLKEALGTRFPMVLVDAESGHQIETLRDELYQLLDVIRIYTKRPGKPADMDNPFTLPRGSTVTELAQAIHKEMADKLKSARLWGTGVTDGQSVPRDHTLHDGDIAELHAD